MSRKLEFGEPDDPLKPADKILEEDREGIVQGVIKRHERLSQFFLHSGVPKDVRQIFETAKNISLYASFAYRLHQPAELLGYIALEQALNRKYEMEFPQRAAAGKKPKLYDLAKIALEREWLTDERFVSRRHLAFDRAQMRKATEAIENRDHDGPITVPEPSEEEIAAEMREMNMAANFLDASRHLRNSLSHGSSSLSPTSIGSLRHISEAINQLFEL